jgi:hypothetical protein
VGTTVSGANYQTSIVVTISPALTGVKVNGTWSDSKTPFSCTTVTGGVCTIGSTNHTNDTSATWTASAVSSLPTGYQAGTNAKTKVVCSKGSPNCTAS